MLVTDFYTSSEATSQVGLALSDEFAVLLAKALRYGMVVDRLSFREYLNRNRIPLTYLKSDYAQRWLGTELSATTVVSAEINLAHGKDAAKFKLLDTRPYKSGESVRAVLPSLDFRPEELQAVEPFPPQEKIPKSKEGETVYQVKPPVVTPPSCQYMPNPNYTDPARSAHFSGVLTIDAIVTPDGKAIPVRVVQGLPYNLNEAAFRIMDEWRCKAGSKDGKPVPTTVVFEVRFQLY